MSTRSLPSSRIQVKSMQHHPSALVLQLHSASCHYAHLFTDMAALQAMRASTSITGCSLASVRAGNAGHTASSQVKRRHWRCSCWYQWLAAHLLL